jgi:TonB family protein
VVAVEDSAPKESVVEVSAPQIPVAPSYDIHAADTDSILDLPESLTNGSQPLPQYFDSAPPTPAKPIPALNVSSVSSGDSKPQVKQPIIPIEEDETVPRVAATQPPRETSWLSTILPAASSDLPERSAPLEAAPANQRARKSSSMLGLSKPGSDEEPSPSHFARPAPPSAAPTSPTAMVVWVLIAFVLGASAFAAYRLTRYLYRAEPPAPIAAAPVEAPAEGKKPAFSVGGELAGTELNIPEPELSFEAARSGAAGPIIVKVRVNKSGRVISAATSSGDRRLRAAAVKAARKATFAPDKLAGLSSRSRVVSGTITYEFQPAPPSIDTSTGAANANEIPTTTTPAPNTDPNAPVVSDTLANAVKDIPAAEYPAAARRANASGTIIVTVRVNRTGKVVSWRSSSGNSQLRAAAIKAARKATFSPDKLSGNGDTLGTITYNFTP